MYIIERVLYTRVSIHSFTRILRNDEIVRLKTALKKLEDSKEFKAHI